MLLNLEKIGKSFSGVPVLRDIDLELREGEVHVLAGENGAGKSTLIKIIAGAHTDYRGRMLLDGRPLRFKSPREASENGVAVIHQEMSLIGGMTVVDNIFLGREKTRGFSWMDRSAQLRQAKTLLAELGLSIDLKKPLAEFPLALQQMVEVAKALAGRVRVLMMDEPTSALNETEAARLFDIIRRMKEKGCGVLFISHRLEEIYQLADRITVLRDGLSLGTYPAAALDSAELVRLMVGREIKQHFPERRGRIGAEILSVEQFSIPDPNGAKKWAERDVSFRLREGEIIGLAGLQGSGKSELLQGLFGSYGRTMPGRIRLAGFPARIRSPRQAMRRGLALLTGDRQAAGIVPQLDVTSNISLATLRELSPGGWMRFKREAAEARRLIREMDIRAADPRKEVRTLSGGNQQKVILARWLAARPRVYLLDEPTRGVDVGAKHEIYELLNRLTFEGAGIVLTTSELPELLALSDRIIVLHRGAVTAEFAREEFSQEKVTRASLGEMDGGGIEESTWPKPPRPETAR
ncbi:MAG: sugar ABC transporter ATP-binding protein [Candidatus Aminicenantales bacterium]